MSDSSSAVLSRARSAPRKDHPLLFFRKFLQQGSKIGCLAASGKALSRASASKVDSHRPQNILELGAGTGAVTDWVVKAMHAQSRLLAVELDREFAEILQHKHPGITVVQANATHVAHHLAPNGLDRLDLVISGLPLPSMPRSAVAPVLDCFRDHARPEAYFSQLTVMPWVYLPFYRKLFHEVHFQFVPWNFPNGGGVYHCRRVRDDYAQHLKDK